MKPRNVNTTLHLDHDGDEITAHVSAEYSPGSPGCWCKRNGDPGDPPEPASVDGIRIVIEFDSLPARLQDRIREELIEQAEADVVERLELRAER